ncbi:MAG: hypothetical protein J5872_04325 [Lachnospiraceae bacterium]|nr:hypothetical protein [Lachnospiraceae bacterium]
MEENIHAESGEQLKNLSYKCPNCTMPLKFDNEMKRFVCEYCDGSFLLEEIKDAANDEEGYSWDENHESVPEEKLEGTRSYVCTYCGAEVVTTAITSATKCPYCGNVLLVSENLTGMLRPNCIIPFEVDRSKLISLFNAFVKKKMFVPKLFKNNPVLQEVQGIYEPFWLYDSGVNGSVTYNATKTKSWSDATYDYVETSYYEVDVDGEMTFKNVPADGSKRLNDDMMDSLEPFDYSKMIEFEPGYLSGHMAERFDVSADANLQRTKKRMWNSAEVQLRSAVSGYSSVTKKSSALSQFGRDVRYALFPVYVFSITYDGVKYDYAVNGQTGKIVGELPFSKKVYRIWKWTRIGIASAIIYLIGFFLG